ncbi:hypothetical protein GTO89_10310 [Heliobacterium gestii]|uniref:Uncharacterized protein n=1 Tax=Heliomicrobium gestii TaxID=2699 RepID=A0A845L9V1_HELGE|nr:CBO0543 family protein [Heliomicrobium gestii]MBM7867155.1 hypothetical protein [Heliomicrobium gestii]MZP43432.1 hypothetical protein [Heliomicrobium gestii]
MSLERIIEFGAWIVMAIALIYYVPKEKFRDSILIFFFKQLLTWFSGILVVQWNLIVYPVRLFASAVNTSFTFEFFVYPGICVLFNLYFPEHRSLLRKAIHYVIYTSGITVFEVVLENYTNLIKYIHWSWYWTWITLFLTFMASRYFYRWFRGDFTRQAVPVAEHPRTRR